MFYVDIKSTYELQQNWTQRREYELCFSQP